MKSHSKYFIKIHQVFFLSTPRYDINSSSLIKFGDLFNVQRSTDTQSLPVALFIPVVYVTTRIQ